MALPGADAPDLDAEWVLDTAATSLDASTRTIGLADGSNLVADGIVLACGATPRRLPGTEGVDGVFTVRTLEDATRLRAAFSAAPDRVVVVGAGFIGAEIAATARSLDLDVTLVEPLEAPLARVLGGVVGAVFADLHRDHGVDVRLGVGVERVETDDAGRASSVTLTDGTRVQRRSS